VTFDIANYLLLAMSLFKAGGAKIGEMFEGKWEGKATFYSGIRGFAENKETKNGKLLTSYRVQDPKDAWYQFKEYAF